MASRRMPLHHAVRLLVVALMAASATVATKEDAWSSETSTAPVLRLTSSNYEKTVFHSGQNGMVKFYQSWCGHSIRLKPTWDQLAEEAHPSIFIANVDCGASKENDICRSYQITTYPTLRYYLDGTEYDYTGSLSLESLRAFIDSNLVAPCNPIADASSTTCSERARKYAEKWLAKDVTKIKGEIVRLGLMMEKSESTTTAELRNWMRERRDILEILHEAKMDEEKSDISGGDEHLDEL